MPFANLGQMKECYTQDLKARVNNKRSKWDCDEFLKAGCLPLHQTKKNTKKDKCVKVKKTEKRVYYQGKNGGIFYFVGGVKIYVPVALKNKVMKKYKVKKYIKK